MNETHHLLTKIRQSAYDFLAQAGFVNFQRLQEQYLLCGQFEVLQTLAIHQLGKRLLRQQSRSR